MYKFRHPMWFPKVKLCLYFCLKKKKRRKRDPSWSIMSQYHTLVWGNFVKPSSERLKVPWHSLATLVYWGLSAYFWWCFGCRIVRNVRFSAWTSWDTPLRIFRWFGSKLSSYTGSPLTLLWFSSYVGMFAAKHFT